MSAPYVVSLDGKRAIASKVAVQEHASIVERQQQSSDMNDRWARRIMQAAQEKRERKNATRIRLRQSNG